LLAFTPQTPDNILPYFNRNIKNDKTSLTVSFVVFRHWNSDIFGFKA